MSKEDLIQHFRNAGNACFKRKSYAEAITNYEKGLDLDETNPNLNNNIAQAYLETHDYRNAEEYAKRAIKKSPESPKGYFRAARASAGLGYKGRALKYLRDGIDNCEDKKDLIDYYHALREDGAAFLSVDDVSDEPPPLVSDSDTDDSIDDNKLRSRSTSRMITELTYLDSHRENGSHRSVSMSRTSSMSSTSSKINKKGKKKKGPIEMEDILRDPFLSTLETIKKEKGIQNLSPEQFWVMKRKDFNLLLKEGSEVMASGLSRKAVEKYKAALDMIVDHSIEDFRMKEIEFLALKYALCVAWIELTNYADIAKAIEYLIDIESTRASKFPAVFYGLGSAYYKLNRFKASTEHLEKGLFFLNRQVKFEVLSWPGTNNIIPETTRSGLEELLKELLKTCRAYHEPDAICRYSQCLTLSSHIIPSDHIFYSDPDFCGFVVVFCEEKCKIEYHLGCWKEYKEVSSSDKVGKLSDKDFIGRECPTTDCLNQHNNRSAIVKIEIVGDDTTIKTCIEAPKVDPLVKESKKSKKKKTEKSSEASNQEKPKSKNRQKVKKTFAETVSQPIPQQEVQTTNSAEELESRISKLDLLRDVKFGYTDNEIMDPREIFFGRADMKIVDDFFSPEFDNDSPEIKAKKEFVFSFFYEYIKSEGPQKLKEVEQKWQSEVVEYEDVKDFMETQPPICSFLLQSYRFAAIDDYICLSEQLPDAYKRAKTELCESLSFTLTGQAKCSNQLNENHDMEIENGSIIPKNNIDISSSKKEVSKLLDDISEPCKNGDSEEVEKNSENNQNIKKDGRNDSISEKFDDIEVEDPDIDIDIDTDTSDSNIMKERTHLSVEKSVVSGGDEDNDIDSVNSGAQITDSEDKNVEEKEGDEIVKSELSPTAGEFQVENIEKQKIEDTIKTSGFLEDKTVQSRDSAIKNTDLESKPPTLIDQTVRPTHQQWSLEDSLPSESVHLVRTPYLQQYPSLIPAVSPVQLIPRNNALTQTDFNLKEFNNRKRLEEIDKIEEKINMKQKKLDEAVKKHDKEKAIFEEEKKKQAQEAKLENAKIKKEMEKEKNVLKEKMAKLEKENTTMKEKMTKLCDKLKNENTRLEKEKLELEKSCNASKEQLRDLISKTGQEVKELEKERDQYQELVVELKIETAKLKSGIYKQKCHDIRQAMIRKEGLSETESSKMTQVIIALQKCETALKTYEEKVKAKCDAVVSKIGSISSGEFFNIEWPHLPIGPGCPLQAMEELTQKVTEENRKLENSVAEGKHTAKLNVDDRLTFKDFWFHSAEAPKQQNKTSDNLDGQSIIKMEDKLGIFPQFETNAQNFQLNNVQSRQPKSLFDTQINPSAGMPLFQQTHVANQGQRFMMPHYFEKPRPLFPVYASQYPAVVPCTTAPRYPAVVPCATPTLQPTDNNPGIFANDKAPVRVQQIPTSSPATELKPTVVTVTDRKIEQPNVPQLMKDMQDLTLPVSTNKAVPEKKLVTSAFEIRSLSPPFRTVGSKPAPVSSVSSIAAARPKLVAVPTPSMSATIMKKPGGSSYLKLMAQLHKNFPTKTEEELEACVAEVREKNNNSLSGLALPTIITKVDKVLKERTLKKQGSMGLDKFGGTPWGGLLAPTNSWSKPKDNYDGDCPICMEPMERDLTSLQCKHCFHKECIKKWLRTNSICPNCRVFTKLEEEFPPLS